MDKPVATRVPSTNRTPFSSEQFHPFLGTHAPQFTHAHAPFRRRTSCNQLHKYFFQRVLASFHIVNTDAPSGKQTNQMRNNQRLCLIIPTQSYIILISLRKRLKTKSITSTDFPGEKTKEYTEMRGIYDGKRKTIPSI
jgi:hypothetical protein